MFGRKGPITKGAHLKEHTAGTSNELSFDVLDAARRQLDDKNFDPNAVKVKTPRKGVGMISLLFSKVHFTKNRSGTGKRRRRPDRRQRPTPPRRRIQQPRRCFLGKGPRPKTPQRGNRRQQSSVSRVKRLVRRLALSLRGRSRSAMIPSIRCRVRLTQRLIRMKALR